MENRDVPNGYCQCGCGGRTSFAKQNIPALGLLKGEPRRFIRNHHQIKYRNEKIAVLSQELPYPLGECQCGCGGKTNLARNNIPRYFLKGHNHRLPTPPELLRELDNLSYPLGECQCGCGAKTDIPRTNDVSKGWAAGRPKLYLQHHSRKRERRGDLFKCFGCGEFLHYSEFDSGKGIQPASRCKECTKEYYDYENVIKNFRSRVYGITDAEYIEMVKSQNGLCAICGEPEKRTMHGKVKSLSIDHDHATGKVRKLLCSGCNHGLGNFKDNVQVILRAAAYITEHKEKTVVQND